ncbi:hypothetical protein CR513_22049, partial [Mucuna pruriens]
MRIPRKNPWYEKKGPQIKEREFSLLPKFSTSNLALLTELVGFTFPRFSDEKSITGGNGAEEDIGLGDSAIVTDPSGAYFLGRPLFFFAGIVPGAATAAAVCGGAVHAGAGTFVVDPPVGTGLSVLGATW